MVSIEPVLVGGQWARRYVQTDISYAPNSAFGTVMALPPAELTRADVIMFGAKHAVDAVAWSVGLMAGGARLGAWGEGVSDIEAFPNFFENNWLLKPGRHSSEGRRLRSQMAGVSWLGARCQCSKADVGR